MAKKANIFKKDNTRVDTPDLLFNPDDYAYYAGQLPGIKVTAPLTFDARNKAGARRGREYLYAGQDESFPLLAGITAGAVGASLAGAGILGSTISGAMDAGSIISSPYDPTNYIPYMDTKLANGLKNIIRKTGNNVTRDDLVKLYNESIFNDASEEVMRFFKNDVYPRYEAASLRKEENMIDGSFDPTIRKAVSDAYKKGDYSSYKSLPDERKKIAGDYIRKLTDEKRNRIYVKRKIDNRETYGFAPSEEGSKYLNKNATGAYYEDHDVILINDDLNTETLSHEVRHRMDLKEDFTSLDKDMIRLLDDAYRYSGDNPDIANIAEKVATNSEIRFRIADKYAIEDYNKDEIDKVIRGMSDKELFNEISRTNAYGYHYMKDLYDRTREMSKEEGAKEAYRVMQAVRKSLEIVPGAAGAAMLYNQNDKEMAAGGTVQSGDWTSEDLFNPVYSRESHRKVDQDARDKRFTEELKQARQDQFENVVVPAVETAIDFTPIIGDVKSLYEAAMETKEGNYAMAALAALGVFPGIPGVTKLRQMISKTGERPIKQLAGPGYSAIGEIVDAVMTPKRVNSMIGWAKAEKNANKSRSFREMFPILPWDTFKADQIAEGAVKEGINYIDDYYNNPVVREKVEKLIKENGRNLPPERARILRERGIIDEKGNIDVEKYINADPHLVGDTYALNPQWAGGYHTPIEKGGETVTYDRNFLYRRNPKTVASNAAHEQNHKIQEVLGFDNMSVYDKASGYYVANPDHSIGRLFREVANDSTRDAWYKSPSELHSYLVEYKKAKKISPDAVIDGKDFDKLLENDKMKKFFNVTEENKPKIKTLINALPALVPAGMVAMSDVEEYAEGGVVSDEDRYDATYKYLTEEKGVSPKQAIAIMANLEGESGINPNAKNGIGAYGIQQWLGPRKAELFKRYGERPSLTDQIDFLIDEHQGKVKGAGWNFVNKGKNLGSDRFNYYMYSRNDFENAPTAADAVIAWNQGFGRPATHELRNETRLEAGRRFAERYGVDFGSNLYGQMGVEDANRYIPSWIREPGGKELNDYMKDRTASAEPPMKDDRRVASYTPSKENREVVIIKEEEEPTESPYAKKVRERQEKVLAMKMDRKRKMDFFNTVWESIKLR